MPDTVHIAGVMEVKLTGSPELAVAISVTPTDELTACAGIIANVIA